MTSRILSVEDILSAPDLPEREVEVPEWGGSVRIRGFTKATQQEMRRLASDGGDLNADRLEMLMFIRGVVEPQFAEADYEALQQKSAVVIDRILRAIMALAGLTREAVDDAKRLFPAQP